MDNRDYQLREQIQEDIRTFMSGCTADLNDTNKTDVLCQIVVDNFKELEETRFE